MELPNIRIRVNVKENIRRLLAEEDTDGDRRITIEDGGNKRFQLKSVDGIWYEVAGTYRLSILLQLLAEAYISGKKTVEVAIKRLFENQVDNLSRTIRERLWDGLTRTIDAEGLAHILCDSKSGDECLSNIYVPYSDEVALDYFKTLAKERPEMGLNVLRLPEKITEQYVHKIEKAPGLLCLGLKENEREVLRGIPFIVPGGRFNEMYGWDSYFESLGLIEDRRIDLAIGMADNFVYEINNYGKILNANRTYYLTRSQPPFLTSMALAIYEHLPKNKKTTEWLINVFSAAIDEYYTVWTGADRMTETGLSRYHGLGIGMPPETEPDHFDITFMSYAKRAKMDVKEYAKKYHTGEIKEPKLDAYFIHDRAMRESGHDTTYRLTGCAADLNTVDLNSLLYKYELDIAHVIRLYFNDCLKIHDNQSEKYDVWMARAETRKAIMNELLWNKEKGMYFDYNYLTHQMTEYESASTFYPLWSGLATIEQAEMLVKNALPILEAPGGLLASTELSRGEITEDRPQRQWDYPFGWAPHQMIAWEGFQRYGYEPEASRLAYRWLYMMTRDAADYNGIIPEKYDVIARSHKVFAEYGNEGTEFDYITPSGFGWMNASFQVGLTYLTTSHREALEHLFPPEWIFGGMIRFQNIYHY